ncbi:MAG: hypothetical protein JSS44_11340 [Proteobacteria bacterium]|nr:hypothetical protein [Pseudomonadota bacterium]
MSQSFDIPPESVLLLFRELDTKSMTEKDAAHYKIYSKALTSVIKGSSISSAAKFHRVRRNTLADVLAESMVMHADGRPVGYRACLRHHRRFGKVPAPATQDQLSTASPTLASLLRVFPVIAALIDGFKGVLPERNRPSRAFATLMKKVVALITGASAEPYRAFAISEACRRAIVRRIRKARGYLPEPDLDLESTDSASETRQDQLFELKPFDRIEGDGHKTDVKWRAQVTTPDGHWVARLIHGLWIIVLLDVASRAIVAWVIVVGRSYRRFDLLRSFARALTPWKRRKLIVPGLVYHPEAWMPNAVGAAAEILRAASVAIDSFMAHLAKFTTHNLGENQLGIVNHGYPGVPEGRPFIEAFFKKIEELIFRALAGGFRPASSDGSEATTTTNLKPEDYPVQLHALDDLMDVAASAYNVVGQDDLQNRSPRDVCEAYFENTLGAYSTLTEDDALGLMTIRIRVRIKGTKKKPRRQPFVNWMGARYRSRAMHGDYDSIGKTFDATVPADDLRRMVLWKDGKLFAVLHVLPPWSRTPHNFETRQRAIACKKQRLISWEGRDDAVEAYLDAVRQWASERRWATDEFLRHGLADEKPKPRSSSVAPSPASSPIFGISPRRRSR